MEVIKKYFKLINGQAHGATEIETKNKSTVQFFLYPEDEFP